jgi:hypothetical protein
MDFGTGTLFTRRGFTQILISPTDNSQVGTYKVIITLTDMVPVPKSTINSFFIYVRDIININIVNNTVVDNSKLNKMKNSTQLTAYIDSISKRGLTIVRFNKLISIPTNYTRFNDRDLLLSILPGDTSNID